MTWAIVGFVLAVALFTAGAALNGLGASWRTAREVIEVSIMVVFMAAVVSDFRGCSVGGGGFDDVGAVTAAPRTA